MRYVIAIVVVLTVILIGILVFGGDNGAVEEHAHPHEEMRGVHIMPDGRVMSGSGVVVEGATIEADGRVRMPSGMLVTPSQDLR